MNIRKPTKEEMIASAGRTVPDLLARNLRVLFCGINPGLYSAATGHHFARPGNRFWPTLYAAGFTTRQLSPFEERELLKSGYGITNVAARATATADELMTAELIEGGKILEKKVRRYRPLYLAVLGVTVYRTAFGRPEVLGLSETSRSLPRQRDALCHLSGLRACLSNRRLASSSRRATHPPACAPCMTRV